MCCQQLCRGFDLKRNDKSFFCRKPLVVLIQISFVRTTRKFRVTVIIFSIVLLFLLSTLKEKSLKSLRTEKSEDEEKVLK